MYFGQFHILKKKKGKPKVLVLTYWWKLLRPCGHVQ